MADPATIHHVPATHRPILDPRHTYGSVTDKISSIVLTRKTGWGWLIGFGIGFLFVIIMLWSIGELLVRGIGIWGVNVPVARGFAIVNFV